MAKTFTCPSCGAPLETDGKDPSIHCEYCGATVIVPPELRVNTAPETEAPHTSATSRAFVRPRQIRRMMRAIRSGDLDEATGILQQATGYSYEISRQTVERIATQISKDGRISPAELADFMNTTDEKTIQSRSLPASRRRAGMGCLIVILLLIFAYSANPNTAFFSGIHSIISGLTNDQAFIPASTQDPFGQMQTQLSPILSKVTALASTVQPALGGPLLSFGGEGIGHGLFKDARSIAVDAQGQIYAADYIGGRIQRFDSQGKFLSQFSVNPKNPLTGMAVSPEGTIYLVQSGVLQSYAGATGKSLGKITASGVSSFQDILYINAGPRQGQLAATEGGIDDNIVIFEPNGKVSLLISKAISTQTGDSELDMHIAVDDQGNIYALGAFTNAVFKFGPDGKYINRFGEAGSDPGQFQAPENIAVDDQNQVYISDIKGIQVFTSNGRYLKTLTLPEGVPFGMAISQTGNLLVTSRTNIYELSTRN